MGLTCLCKICRALSADVDYLNDVSTNSIEHGLRRRKDDRREPPYPWHDMPHVSVAYVRT